MHRALAHFRLGTMNLITASCLFVFFSSAWLVLLPQVCGLWTRIFRIGIRFLPLSAEVGISEHHWTSFLSLDIPYLRMEPGLPSAQVWWLSCAVTSLIFVATFFISKRLIPVIYLMRAILLVQAIALLYFALIPARFPHTPDSYLAGFVTSGIGLISLVPLIFGLTYYIFDFGLLRKALLTLTTMAHLALFLGIGLLAAVAQVLQTLAYRYGSTHRVAPFSYAALVVSIGIGWLVFGAVPDAWSLLGMSIIAAAGLAMVLRR